MADADRYIRKVFVTVAAACLAFAVERAFFAPQPACIAVKIGIAREAVTQAEGACQHIAVFVCLIEFGGYGDKRCRPGLDKHGGGKLGLAAFAVNVADRSIKFEFAFVGQYVF